MCITEYDEAETMRMFKEEGREEGRAEGRAEGLAEGEEIRRELTEKIEEQKAELIAQNIKIESLIQEIEKMKMAMAL